MTEQSQEQPEGVEPAGSQADADFAHDDALVDEMDEESFPGSDPPSTWAGHDRPAPDGG
ncbi:hypothetical protein [Oryzobacter terrae]|uniref:hypothetical protein n=1 Tax=Oryzobacter terrae TaxID=1620385 RepID=UPI003670EE3A